MKENREEYMLMGGDFNERAESDHLEVALRKRRRRKKQRRKRVEIGIKLFIFIFLE
jgi:hypothetical protein